MNMQTFRAEIRCVACRQLEAVYVSPKDYIRWSLDGVHAQDAFPYLTDDEREVLITSMCLDCIEELYKDMEEDEWDDEHEEDCGCAVCDSYDMRLPLDPESDDPSYDSDYYVDCD